MSKVLVIKLGALGDMVLASAAFAAVRRSLPAGRLFLLTTPAFFPLMRGCRHFEDYFFFDREQPFLPQLLRLAPVLKREKFRLVVNLQNNLKSNLLAWSSAAPERVGFRRGPRRLLTRCVAYDRKENALVNLNRVLSLAGVPPAEVMELYLTSQAEAAAAALLEELGWRGEALVGLHPGASAGWRSKRWPRRNWTALAQAVSRRGWRPVFFGDAGEAAELARMADEASAGAINLAGRTDLPTLAAAIRRCRAFVSTDSGPLFIAAAAGVKTAGLYGPTESRRHAPPGVTALEGKDLACRPCYRKDCPLPVCMDRVTVADVAAAIGVDADGPGHRQGG